MTEANQDSSAKPSVSLSDFQQLIRKMYFDKDAQKPRRGAGGKGGGSARRLASVARQLELTYDLQDCPPARFLALLPREFKTWVRQASPIS